MAMMASKGAVDAFEAAAVVEEGEDETFPAPAPEVLAARDRSVVELEAPRRSPAVRRDDELFMGCVEDSI